MSPVYLILAALALAMVYVFGEKLRIKQHRRRWLSAAAGVSVAYVFIQLFSELREAHEQFMAETVHRNLPFPEHRVAVAALLGFLLFYGMENLVTWSRRTSRWDEEHGHPLPVFWMHLGGFAAYSALVAYLVVRWPEATPAALGLYALAMSIHFVGVDHSMREEHGEIYDRRGRWVLATAVVAGAAVGSMFVIPIEILSTLRGFIAGGVIINSMIMELPKENEGRFGAFCIGAVSYAALLILV